jgi:hypothetical protein
MVAVTLLMVGKGVGSIRVEEIDHGDPLTGTIPHQVEVVLALRVGEVPVMVIRYVSASAVPVTAWVRDVDASVSEIVPIPSWVSGS